MKYNCPVCGAEMEERQGNYFHPGDPKFGMSLACPNSNCSAQEVAGYGSNAGAAWKIVQDKFVLRKDRD